MKPETTRRTVLTGLSCIGATGILSDPGRRPALAAGSPAYKFVDDFEGRIRAEWIPYGVRGEGGVAADPRGGVAFFHAGENIGGEVGKACLVHPFPTPLLTGDRLEIALSLYLPDLVQGRISLIDIECKNCGVPAQPGIRLFVDIDRRIYLERGKLGHQSSFWQYRQPFAPVDEWFDLRWATRFGVGDEGTCAVWIDDRLILEAAGANFPDQAIAERFDIDLAAEQYDRVQIGITANSQPRPTSIRLDDVSIAVFPEPRNAAGWRRP